MNGSMDTSMDTSMNTSMNESMNESMNTGEVRYSGYQFQTYAISAANVQY